jgi:hypothetical protein
LVGGFNSGPSATNTSNGTLVYALGLDWGLWCNSLNGQGWIPEGPIDTHLDPAVPNTGVDVVAMGIVRDDGGVAVWLLFPNPPLPRC